MRASSATLGYVLAVVGIATAGEKLYRGFKVRSVEDAEKIHANAAFAWGLGDVSHPSFQKRAQHFRELQAAGLTVFTNSAFSIRGEKRFFKQGVEEPEIAIDYDYLGQYVDIWTERLRAVAAAKPPTVLNITPDEITWSNAHIGYTFYGIKKGIPDTMPYYCDSDACKKEFKKRTKLDHPKLGKSRFLKANTRANREFILFRYQVVAEALARFQAAAREADPEFKSYMMLNLAPVMGLERYHSGVALDVIGQTFTPDYLMSTVFHLCTDYRGPDTHYLAAETAKHLKAANPKTKVMPFTCAMTWGEAFFMGREVKTLPADLIAKIPYSTEYRAVDLACINISAVAHGADGVAMYGRLTEGIVEDSVGKGFLALEKAEPWILGSEVPPDIVLLYSRAGEDFYGLAHEDPKLDAAADGSLTMREMGGFVQPCNALTHFLGRDQEYTLGFRAHKQLIYFLFKNGYPFRMHYLDSLRKDELQGARLIVSPFAHAISKDSAGQIRAAVEAGAKLLVFGQLGEVDQGGAAHPAPLLQPLQKNPNVVYIEDPKAASRANSPEWRGKIDATIKSLLGNRLPLCLGKPDGAEVEAALRTKSPTDQTAFLINWDDKPHAISLGLRLPTGQYQMEMWDVMNAKAAPSLKPSYEAEALAAHKLELPPFGAFIVHVKAK